MKLFRTISAFTVLCSILSRAHANPWEFTYEYRFNNGVEATGTFIGSFSQQDLMVTDVSDVTLWLDGVQQTGPFALFHIDGSAWQPGAVISFDYAQDNFLITNGDPNSLGVSSYFGVAHTSSPLGFPSALAGWTDASGATFTYYDPTISGDTHLTYRNVPDGGSSIALLGIAIVGLVGLRRRFGFSASLSNRGSRRFG